jgi:asparagine synthase (glutamine-hydrolysing)
VFGFISHKENGFMCGIVGLLSFRNSSFTISESLLTAMRDTMVHRGPDGAGNWISPDQRVGLGHRRLSIIDLSDSAAQPMANEDGSLQVVFNGEIYNHAEIRAELERCGGHTWKTDHSDTEVILHAFEEWGIDCLHRFRGMFAIALWDAKKRELWLIRDRIGIKPLYYSVHHGRITFASEIKALLRDPEQKRSVDEEAFYHYLSFLTTPAPQTLFAGIRKLAGGTWLRVSESGDLREQRYWDVWEHTTPLIGVSEEEIAERLLSELRTAVRLRKVSDVPVGVFLSGGIDSSTNTALFSEGEARPVKTFAIGYDGEHDSYKNELDYARQMAGLAGAEHHERILTQQDLLDFLPRMVQLQDEPIADPVCVPIYYVSKLARENGVIVCQVGEGADELFWGYPLWKTKLGLQRLNDFPIPRILKRTVLAGMRVLGKEREWAYEMLRRAVSDQPVFWGGAEVFTETEKQRLISPSLRSRLGKVSSWDALRPIRKRFEDKAWERSHLNWMSYLDLNLRLPELLLMRVDKMSMGVSLEGRVPFLDHKFVELAMSIPTSVKTKNGTLKYILKKSVRGLIPDELIDRKKQGFGVPIHEFSLNELGSYARTRVEHFSRRMDLLNVAEVKRLLEPATASSAQSFRTWSLLNVAMWWEEYIVGGGSSPSAGPEPVASGYGAPAYPEYVPRVAGA